MPTICARISSSESVSVSSATRSACCSRCSHCSKSCQFRIDSYCTGCCRAAEAGGSAPCPATGTSAAGAANRAPVAPDRGRGGGGGVGAVPGSGGVGGGVGKQVARCAGQGQGRGGRVLQRAGQALETVFFVERARPGA